MLEWIAISFSRDLPDPGIEPGFPALQADALPSEPPGKPASLVKTAEMVKNLPAVWKTRVRSLGWEDSLEKGTATHYCILAWRSLWTEDPGRLQSVGL